jgi:hypothetical protein
MARERRSKFANDAKTTADISSQLAQLPTKDEVDVALNDIGVNQINKNKGLIDQTFLTDELKQQIAGTAPINAVPADFSLTENKFAFPILSGIKSKNLFNKDTVTQERYLNAEGTLSGVVAGFTVSDWIPASANTTYTISNMWNANFYDANKVNISQEGTNATFTTPANTAYIRLTTQTANLETQQLETGSVATPYVSYRAKVDIETLPAITNDKLAGNITKDKLAFPIVSTVRGKNFFDKTAITNGKYPSAETGVLSDNASMSTSGWIAVDPNTAYTVHFPFIVVAYNANKEYISSLSEPTFTTPATAAYVRFGMFTSNLDVQQMELGSAKTSYEAYGAKIAREDILNLDNPYPYEFLLPNNIYLVSGEMFSIFYENIVKYFQNFTKGNYYITVQEKLGNGTYAIRGKAYNYKWEYTPVNTDTTFNMEFRIVSTFNDSVIASKVVTFTVANSSLAANHNRSATFVTIGDSFTDGYDVTSKLYDNIKTKGGINNANFIGLNHAHWTNPAVKDNAWSGYTYSWFYDSPTGYLRADRPLSHAVWDTGWGENEVNGWTTGQTYDDLTEVQKSHGHTKNEFYNPATQKFDFSYFMSTYMGNQAVDGFICNLGLNDVGWVTVNEVKANLNSLKTKIQHIINSVKAYNANIKILLYTIPKQIADNATIGSNWTNFSHYERVNHNIELFNSMLITEFSAQPNVYIMATGANFDSRTGFKMANYNPNKFNLSYVESHPNDIHPSDEGSNYIADTLYQAVYNLVLK